MAELYTTGKSVKVNWWAPLMFHRTAVLQEEPVSARRTLSRRFTETLIQVHLSAWVHGPTLWNEWVVTLLIPCTAYTHIEHLLYYFRSTLVCLNVP